MAWWNFGSEPESANEDKRLSERGFLTESFSNPWVSIPYAIVSGLAAGATPGTARASQGLAGGLQMGLAGEEGAYKSAREKRLSESLGKFIDSTEPREITRTANISPGTIAFSQPEMDPQELAQERQYTATENVARFSPVMREYLKQVNAVEPRAAMQIAGQALLRDKEDKTVPLSRDQILVNERTGKEIARGLPAEPKGHLVQTTDEQGKPVQRWMTEDELRRVGSVPTQPKESKEPPSLDDNLVDQGLAELATTGQVSRRVMHALQTDDPARAKSILLMRQKLREEGRVQKKQDDMTIALAKTRLEYAMQPMQGMTLDKKTGEVVSITKGDYASNPSAYIRLTPGQERMKGGLDTAKTHMVVTSNFIDALPKSGLRVTNALGQKISQLQNDPKAVALFQQLHSMTSLAVGSALVGGAGGRPGVRLAEFMAPAGVTEGDTLASAVQKMQVWMNIVERNAKEGGLPSAPYQQATREMKYNVIKHLVREAGGDIDKAKQNAKVYGLNLE